MSYLKFEELNKSAQNVVLNSVNHYLENKGMAATKKEIHDEANGALYSERGQFLCYKHDAE